MDDHLRNIRLGELEAVIRHFPAGGRILEIGAGSGWQTAELARLGYAVEAVDIPDSAYREEREWPVAEYDGRTLPFPDESFDVVFSSNVLEHVPHLGDFHREMRRVLKRGGRAVHILPTPSWRVWTSLAHYPFLMKYGAGRLSGSGRRAADRRMRQRERELSLLELAMRVLLPGRHGVRGNILSETRYFSRGWWRGEFARGGWRVAEVFPAGLFYTGYSLLGERLGLSRRRELARLLGSSCDGYLLKKE